MRFAQFGAPEISPITQTWNFQILKSDTAWYYIVLSAAVQMLLKQASNFKPKKWGRNGTRNALVEVLNFKLINFSCMNVLQCKISNNSHLTLLPHISLQRKWLKYISVLCKFSHHDHCQRNSDAMPWFMRKQFWGSITLARRFLSENLGQFVVFDFYGRLKIYHQAIITFYWRWSLSNEVRINQFSLSCNHTRDEFILKGILKNEWNCLKIQSRNKLFETRMDHTMEKFT